MTSPIISFQDFGFQYDAQAEPTLHHINLDVYPGQKILIAGASGSGKSTVASCINGLIPHAYPGKITGKVLVDGKDVTQSSVFDLSHTVGTVLQDTDGQFIGLTVAEDIAFALENDCVPQDDMKKTVQRVAQLVDIEHHLDHAPYELSGGQKQRVSLAGVMVDDVKVLLFDEPLANLDPAAGRVTIELNERCSTFKSSVPGCCSFISSCCSKTQFFTCCFCASVSFSVSGCSGQRIRRLYPCRRT